MENFEIKIVEIHSHKNFTVITVMESLQLRNFAVEKNLLCFIYKNIQTSEITEWRIVFHQNLYLIARCNEHDKIDFIKEIRYK